MSRPVVTVICLCYNHEKFVEEAIRSVWLQTFSSIQLIIVDDASLDNSVSIIKRLIEDKPEVIFIANDKNLGSCQSFNIALRHAIGDYIIDLAADDVLMPSRVMIGLETLEKAGSDFGVQFSDAEIISETGNHLYYHSEKFPHHTIPQGDIYKNLIDRYFICSPTMMFKREALTYMGGYDEALAYEDFDLWIRSSRKFKYCYSSNVLVKRRLVSSSMSRQQFIKASKQRWSTLVVCRKIKVLNKNFEEDKALQHRLRYELFLSLKMMDIRLALEFLKLWVQK